MHFRHRSIYPNNDNKKKKNKHDDVQAGNKGSRTRCFVFIARRNSGDSHRGNRANPVCRTRAVEYIFTRTTRTTAAVRVSLRDNSRIFFGFFFFGLLLTVIRADHRRTLKK